jgi:hypothetical protein
MATLNNKLLWAVKFVAAIFNAPSTGYVFYGILDKTERSEWLVWFNTILAVLLIDLFFLWVLTVLEDESIDPIKRMPMAISAVLLSVAIVIIGVMDEGVLSYAPRIGLLALVFNDLVGWGTDYWAHYNSREQIEQRIRKSEVVARRRMNEKTLKAAIKESEADFQARHRSRILEQLGQSDSEHSEPEKVLAPEELPEHVFKADDGTYGWVSPVTGERTTKTSLGKPYNTMRGAQIAVSRHVKEHTENGKHR